MPTYVEKDGVFVEVKKLKPGEKGVFAPYQEDEGPDKFIAYPVEGLPENGGWWSRKKSGGRK